MASLGTWVMEGILRMIDGVGVPMGEGAPYYYVKLQNEANFLQSCRMSNKLRKSDLGIITWRFCIGFVLSKRSQFGG